MSRHRGTPFAFGNAPSYWQREMVRCTAWAFMLRRSGDWIDEVLVTQLSLNEEPLLGRSLIALTAEPERQAPTAPTAARSNRSGPARAMELSESEIHSASASGKRVRKPKSGTSEILSTLAVESRFSQSKSQSGERPGLHRAAHVQELLPVQRTGWGQDVPLQRWPQPDVLTVRSLLHRLAGEPGLVRDEERPRKRLDSVFHPVEQRHSLAEFQSMARQSALSPRAWQNALIAGARRALYHANPFAPGQTGQEQEQLSQQWSAPIDGPAAPLELLLNTAHLLERATATAGSSERNSIRKSLSQERLATAGSESSSLHGTARSRRVLTRPYLGAGHVQEQAGLDPPLLREGNQWKSPPFERGSMDSSPPEEQLLIDEQASRILPPVVAPQLSPLTTPQGMNVPPLPIATATVRLGARAEMTMEEDLDILAARIKRILDDEARRHGIDV